MKTAKHVYNLLLRLYPHSYRNAFGEQMLQTFIDQYMDIAQSAGRERMDFWRFMVTDEIKNITRQHLLSLREDHALLPVTLAKVVVSGVLLIPLYGVCYAALVTAVLAVPHPPVSGLSFLIVLAMLVFLAGILSTLASYVLASLVVRVLPKRNASML